MLLQVIQVYFILYACLLSESGKVDLFLKKKSAQLPKKKEKLKSKAAERKELLNHLKLLAKLEAEVNWKQNYGKKVSSFSIPFIPMPPHGKVLVLRKH